MKEDLVSLCLLQPCCCVNLAAGTAGGKAQKPHQEGDHLPSCEHRSAQIRGCLDWGRYRSLEECCVQHWEHSWADFSKTSLSYLVALYVAAGINHWRWSLCSSPCPSSRIWLNWLPGHISHWYLSEVHVEAPAVEFCSVVIYICWKVSGQMLTWYKLMRLH